MRGIGIMLPGSTMASRARARTARGWAVAFYGGCRESCGSIGRNPSCDAHWCAATTDEEAEWDRQVAVYDEAERR